MASIHDERLLTCERCKVVLQGLDDGTGTEIGATDADDDEDVRFLAQVGSGLFDVGQHAFLDFRREVDPTKEIITGAGLIVYGVINTRDFLL